MRNTILWTLTGLTVLLGCAGLIAWDRWMAATADACAGRLCVWIYDPLVAPGGAATLTVGVYDGDEAGLQDVRISGPGVAVEARGEGVTWGTTLSTRSFQRGYDGIDVEIRVPDDAPIGPLALEVDASWVAAVPGLSMNSFSNAPRSEHLVVPLEVRTPASVAALRVVLLGGAALAVLLGAGLCWIAGRQLVAVDDAGDENLTEAAGGALVLLAMAWGFVGWLVLSRPLQAALDLPSTALSVSAVIGWLGLTVGGAWKLGPATTQPPFRLTFSQPLEPEQVERWLRRLRDEGVVVQGALGAVRLSRGADRVWFFRRGPTRGQVALRGKGDDLVLLAAVCAARGVGPLQVVLHGFLLPVGPGDTVDALRQTLDAQVREKMEALLAMLDRQREILDRIRPHVQ